MNYEYASCSSPVGKLFLIATTHELVAVVFDKGHETTLQKFQAVPSSTNPVIAETTRQLQEYFAKKRTAFQLPLRFIGTDFQKAVWQELLTIPYGQTKTYQQQAMGVQNPKAVRAVGRTNGLNPIAIIAPCHRVIGKSGKLTGYAGGLDIKQFLLSHES